ncbi:histidine kinase HHK3 [Penicillium longicatenatum]|nr:histidine kinase HHK3 [Penicillium longicatenatum]
MAPNSGQRIAFFPKADAAILTSKRAPPPTRPEIVEPIFDQENVDRPIGSWPSDVETNFYPKTESYTPAEIPEKPSRIAGRYLRAFLSENERLRLSMMWYYTRDILKEDEFLSGLQEKAHLAQESTGWEFSVIGILDVNVYIRLATVGLELGILPRGETICAHTVTQPPGRILLPNMMEDWRFRESPYLELGGLLAYAGAPLRLQNENGDYVGLGSLCVASSQSEEPLTASQQQVLIRLADWVVSDLVQCARARRQRERRQMSELLVIAQKEIEDTVSDAPVLKILKTAYPNALIRLQPSISSQVEVEGRDPIPISDLEDGLWEDHDCFDDFIANYNHLDPPSDRVVRIITAPCESISGSSLLVVASKDARMVFDDVDSWFVQICAGMLSQMWRKSLLIEAIKAKERFLQGISHQLRTPIHGILGSVELLAEELQSRNSKESAISLSELMKGNPPTNPREPSTYLNIIQTAGRDLTSIVNNLITLNRWADIAMTEREHDLHTVDELEAEIENEILKLTLGDARYKTSVSFTQHLPPGFESFRGDLGVLRDTIAPLIINSIQNTPEGIVSIAILIRPDCRQLIVDVKDNGQGIHPDNQQRIFEPYEKVNSHMAGAGLGLTLACKFATLLYGSVNLISSDVGRGSHFRATFCEVQFIFSSPPQSLTLKLINLPSKYFNLVTDSDGVLVSCRNFADFLTRNSFTASDSIEDCIVLLDAVPDSQMHRMHLSQIPVGQVAICIVPDSEQEPSFEHSANNVVYARGPFSRSIMCSALERAQAIFVKTVASHSGLLEPDQTYLAASSEQSAISAPYNSGSDETIDETAPSASQPDAADLMGLTIATPFFLDLTSSPRPTALIVDDNAINLRIVEMYCNKRGLPSYSAINGCEAVQIFSQCQSLSVAGKGAPIGLVFMDLQMPVCDGIEATKQIRLLEQRNQWKKSTLFILTGQDSPSDRAAADDAGADEYLVKSVVIKQLDRFVKQYFPAFEAC